MTKNRTLRAISFSLPNYLSHESPLYRHRHAYTFVQADRQVNFTRGQTPTTAFFIIHNYLHPLRGKTTKELLAEWIWPKHIKKCRIDFTTLQYMMIAKLNQQRLLPCHENKLIYTIQTKSHMQYLSFISAPLVFLIGGPTQNKMQGHFWRLFLIQFFMLFHKVVSDLLSMVAFSTTFLLVKTI